MYIDDKRCGYGEYTAANYDHFSGEFKDDLFHGYGEMHYINGDHFEGFYENGERNGAGKFTTRLGDV